MAAIFKGDLWSCDLLVKTHYTILSILILFDKKVVNRFYEFSIEMDECTVDIYYIVYTT